MASRIGAVIVTGSSRGIGAATAVRLAASGCAVVLNHRRAESLPLLQQVERRCRAAALEANHEPRVALQQADASTSAGAKALVDAAAAAFPGVPLEGLVNNAGAASDALLVRQDADALDSCLATNLRSVALTTKAAARVMLRQRRASGGAGGGAAGGGGGGGRIVNVASVVGQAGGNGLGGGGGRTAYAAAKAGVVGYTRAAGT